MEWVILIIFLLWLFGRAQHGAPTHPQNALTCNGGSSGDSFTGGTQTLLPGVTQPAQFLSCTALNPPTHFVYPVDGPPPVNLNGGTGIQPVGPAPWRSPVFGRPSPIVNRGVFQAPAGSL